MGAGSLNSGSLAFTASTLWATSQAPAFFFIILILFYLYTDHWKGEIHELVGKMLRRCQPAPSQLVLLTGTSLEPGSSEAVWRPRFWKETQEWIKSMCTVSVRREWIRGLFTSSAVYWELSVLPLKPELTWLCRHPAQSSFSPFRECFMSTAKGEDAEKLSFKISA